MELKYIIQDTPNPNAKKVILNRDVKSIGKAEFTKEDKSSELPLITALLTHQEITRLHFYENTITVTKNNSDNWEVLQKEIIQDIKDNIEKHDIFFAKKEKKQRKLPATWQKIDTILEETIRPSLQRDGGDLIINQYFEKDKILVVEYQGACVSCPSATIGTLLAIKNVLMERWDTKIKVITTEQFNETIKES